MNALLADPVLRLYALCTAILVIKMLVTASATGILRTVRKVYATPEDYRYFGQEPVMKRDEEIERIRRAHLNDLENVLPFFALGFVYALTGPSYTAAAVLFIAFTAGRVAHSIVYIAGLQPWRTVAFFIAQIALYILAIATLIRLL